MNGGEVAIDAGWAWAVLDLAPTSDEREIRRAYARRLKAIDPEQDAPAFIELHEARELVLHLARSRGPGDALGADADATGTASEAGSAPAGTTTPEPAPADAGLEQPRAQAAVPTSAVDPSLFTALEAALAPTSRASDGEIRAAAEALFGDKALDRIGMAESIENWTINLILDTAPRSDAILDLAIARFGWDRNLDDRQRPPVYNWLLQRRVDAGFERELVAGHPGYRDVIERLRTPGAAIPERPPWRLADDVRAFLAYARARHPTSVATCDREAVERWDAWLARPPFLYHQLGGAIRSLTGRGNGLVRPETQPADPLDLLRAFILPFIFAWPLFRSVYSWRVRLFALAWLGLFLGFFAMGGFKERPLEPHRYSVDDQTPAPSFTTSADSTDGEGQSGAAPSDLVSPRVDFDPLLRAYAEGRITMAGIEHSNPRLYDVLLVDWQDAQHAGQSRSALSADLPILMDRFFRDAIRGAPPSLQAEYWRVKADELAWVESYGWDFCDQYLHNPARAYRFPDPLLQRRNELRAQVWLTVANEPPPRAEMATIPGDIVAAAARQAHLDHATFDEAMSGHSTPENNCAASIALARAALTSPPGERNNVLRRMTSLEP